jgi:DNA-binding GntR family transcriptional regulator
MSNQPPLRGELPWPSFKNGPRCTAAASTRAVRVCIAWYITRPMHTEQNAVAARGLLKENVARRLREEILAARISPGEKIVEGEWAREYRVAQISVREALNILATQGFVTKGHGRSARVLKLERADIIHIYQVRGVLEGLAARLITEDRLPVNDLEAAFQEIHRSVGTGDLRQVIDSVQRFHMLMLEKPRNSVLREHGRRLLVPLYAFTLMKALVKKLDVGPWERQLRLHRLIIEVLEQGNPHLAEQMLIHVTNLFLHAALEVWAP